MPGFELIGEEERQAINDLFDQNGGVLFAHGFDAQRNGIYKVREYEKSFAQKLDTGFAQAVSSGSAAIKTGLKALGIGPGDEVITQSFTFVATVEAIMETGARPVIVDIDDTLNMDPEQLEDAITSNTRAIIPVHMLGEGADIRKICDIARNNSLNVLEDTAQALGATIEGKYLGTFGDIGAFSTDAGKILNTGEGGIVTSDSKEFYVQARAYHDHGHEYSETCGRADEAALCQGFNYRMNEIQAAIGLVQLGKLDYILEKQRQNKKKILEQLDKKWLKLRRSIDSDGDAADAIVFYLPDRSTTVKFTGKMRELGLGTKNLPDAIRWHFSGHWDHLFKDNDLYRGGISGLWKQSSELLECSIAIPVMVGMTDGQIEQLADKLNKIAEMTL